MEPRHPSERPRVKLVELPRPRSDADRIFDALLAINGTLEYIGTRLNDIAHELAKR